MVDHVSREHAGAREIEGTLLTRHRARPWRGGFALALALPLSGCAPAAPDGAGPVAAARETVPAVVAASGADLLERVRAGRARATALNVWATWCGPCREEFPDLLRLRETYRARGLDLVLVTGDFDSQLDEARAFLAGHGVDFETYIKTGRDMEFIDTLNPDWSGALPATFVFDGEGRRRDFWEGKASYEEMERRVLPVLGDASPPQP
jgi:thiol-disulfide isomerase/thioredoxin